MFLYIIWSVTVAIWIVCGIALVRNHQVYKARKKMIDGMSEGAHRDIQSGKNYKWRYDTFDKVSYNDMMLRFWVKPERFFIDSSFYK